MRSFDRFADGLSDQFPKATALTGWAVLFILMCLLDCKQPEASAMVNSDSTSISINVNKQNTFTLGKVTKRNVTIKFLGVKEERCPREDCSLCYGGYVSARFTININDQSPDSLTLQRISCIPAGDLNSESPTSNKKQINGLTVALLNITELTKASPTSLDAYRAKVLISAQ